jgi:hypothetical protein
MIVDTPFDGGEDDFDNLDEALDLEEQEGEDFEAAQAAAEAEQGEQEQPRNRGSARIQRLASERDTYAQEAAAARAEAEVSRRQLQELLSGQQRQNSETQEAQRLAQMEPWERAEHIARQVEQRTLGVVGRLERTIADQTDKATFASLCASVPAVAKVSAEVEKLHAGLIQSGGTPPPREMIADMLIGKQIREKATKARTTQARTAAANVSRERAAPVTTGSDVRGGGGKSASASLRERLRDANI